MKWNFGKNKEEVKSESMPEMYSEEELNLLDAHMDRFWGECKSVFHEIASPDIHVDICIIEPTTERNYYTLITQGMGAHRMNTPEELAEYKLERAEIMVCLPPDWDVQNNDEKWYWPLRWLKVLARLPLEQDTWLGWGHTVPKGEPFAENTKLCGVMLLEPQGVEEDAFCCPMPDGSEVNFYQYIPLYEKEMDYKIHFTAEALLERMNLDHYAVQIQRADSCEGWSPEEEKPYRLSAREIKPLLTDWAEPEGCIATDRITVDGQKVGYMYRDEPTEDVPDSGWRFLAGDEDDAYMEDAEKSDVYALNTICNYDPDIIPLLHAPQGTAYWRDENGVFQEEAFEPGDEE